MSFALKAIAAMAYPYVVAISNQSVTATSEDPLAATARYELLGSGLARTVVIENGAETPTNLTGEWLVAGAVADFEVRAVLNSGTLTEGTLNTWTSMAGNNVWRRTANTIGDSGSCSLTFTIRRALDSTILDTATVTLTANVEPVGP